MKGPPCPLGGLKIYHKSYQQSVPHSSYLVSINPPPPFLLLRVEWKCLSLGNDFLHVDKPQQGDVQLRRAALWLGRSPGTE